MSVYKNTFPILEYEEGCQIVEMECATMAAVARFRGIRLWRTDYAIT